MSATFEIKSTEKLNDRVRKGTNFLKENTPEAKKTDVQHLFAILTGLPNWQTLHAQVVNEESKKTTHGMLDDKLYAYLLESITSKYSTTSILNDLRLELVDTGDLTDQATANAIYALSGNWFKALQEGHSTDDILGDIDDICGKLQAFKKAARYHILGEQPDTTTIEKVSLKRTGDLEPIWADVYSKNQFIGLPQSVKVTPTEELIAFIRTKMYEASNSNATLSCTNFPDRDTCLTWYLNCEEDVREYGETEEASKDNTYCPVLEVDDKYFAFKCHNKNTGDECESDLFDFPHNWRAK